MTSLSNCYLRSTVTLLCFLALGESQAQCAELVTVSKAFEQTSLVAIDNHELKFRSNDSNEERLIPWQELVCWSTSQQRYNRAHVLLTDGTLLDIAEAWTKRDPTFVLKQGSITVSTKLFGELEIPRDQLLALIIKPPIEPIARQLQLDGFLLKPAKTDQIHLQGGDLLLGTVSKLTSRELEVQTSAGPLTLDFKRVQAVAFRSAQRTPPSLSDMYAIAGMKDGSLISARSIQASADNLTLTTCGGLSLKAASIGQITSLQMINSPKFKYLSDLQPSDYRHMPYLELEWRLGRDRNVLGGSLNSQGQRFLKGLGMHSAARTVYPLDEEYQRFEASIAIDDSANNRGSAIFRVFLATDSGWTEAFTSSIIRGGQPPQPVSLDIADAQAITLLVDYADRGDELDHANWLNARLLR